MVPGVHLVVGATDVTVDRATHPGDKLGVRLLNDSGTKRIDVPAKAGETERLRREIADKGTPDLRTDNGIG
ncbi:MAG: hypothetical protein IPM60_01130 [Rhodospirillales bacterium]|nr:hypothetical protein [Rhodospirillales bacterium]